MLHKYPSYNEALVNDRVEGAPAHITGGEAEITGSGGETPNKIGTLYVMVELAAGVPLSVAIIVMV